MTHRLEHAIYVYRNMFRLSYRFFAIQEAFHNFTMCGNEIFSREILSSTNGIRMVVAYDAYHEKESIKVANYAWFSYYDWNV